MGICCNKCPFEDSRNSLILITNEKNKKELKLNTIEKLEDENYKDLFCRHKLSNKNVNDYTNKYVSQKSLSSNQSDFNDNYDIIHPSKKAVNKNVDELNIIFLFNDTKELYLTVNSSLTIKQIVEKLKEKYNLNENYKEINFYLNDKIIEENATIKELGIKDYDKIKIQAF